jgi:hypothetical protein
MTTARALPEDVVGFTGVYDADGGLRGELAYVVGHLLGRTECALCDITHSAVRRKASWDRGVARLGVPFDLVHRNEQSADVSAVTVEQLPCVVVHLVDGTRKVVLGKEQLRDVTGDVDRFFDLLAAATGNVT